MRKSGLTCGLFMALVASPPAQAEWREARTNHFVLTIDDTEEGARAFATRLERFDGALRRLYGITDDPDQHHRPVAIYAINDKLFQEGCGGCNALGYYQPRMRNSVIVSIHMPKLDRKTMDGWWSSQTLLLHEYSHHFAYNNFDMAYPYWFSEGFAEFNATARFADDGGVLIGFPANYRADAIKSGGKISPKQLFDPHRYGFNSNIDLVYGRGWLLTHLLMLKPERGGQLGKYLAAVNKGTPSLDAAEASFGDLKALTAELDAYARGALAPSLRVAPLPAPVKVTLRTLSAGEAAMMPFRVRVINGLSDGRAKMIANKATRIARQYPADAIVQAQWAEAELAAGRLEEADQAADAALRLQPAQVDSLVLKGLVASRRLTKAKSTDKVAWVAARSWFLRANQANPNAVLPLYHFYSGFVAAKATPSRSATKGLMRAQVLAPESRTVRLMLARHELLAGDAGRARALLQPLAFEPHRQRDANLPRQVVDLIDAGKLAEAKALIDPGDDVKD